MIKFILATILVILLLFLMVTFFYFKIFRPKYDKWSKSIEKFKEEFKEEAQRVKDLEVTE